MSDELVTSSDLSSVPAARSAGEEAAESAHVPEPAPAADPGTPGGARPADAAAGLESCPAPAPAPTPRPDADPFPAEPVTDARTATKIVRVALLAALALNTAGFVRSGLTMHPGLMRDTLLTVGHPLDTVARALNLDGPRRALDAAFGHPDDVGRDGRTRLESDAAAQAAGPAPLPAPRPAAQGPAATPGAPGPYYTPPKTAPVDAGVRVPTAADPLRVLVTGDSLSDFDGQQLAKIIAAQGLPMRLRNQPRNGTGLTQPNVFDWADEAAADATDYDPDVVVMVLGANDGWPVDGSVVGSTSWVAEYTRRVEAVTRDFLAGDPRRRVYWVGPPIPRAEPWIHIFDRVNQAVRDAVPEVPGLRYVDVAWPTSEHGSYTDYLTAPDGTKVLARQRDGIHYSWAGSVFPARLILAALEGEYRLR